MSTELDLAQKRGQSRERLSALVDGELSPEASRACLAAVGRDETLLAYWADCQRVGDVLRGGAALAGRGNELAFLATFRERLAAEAQSASDAASAKVVPFPAIATATAGNGPKPQERTAANDRVYRWKMVAGLATVMAVLVVGWAALDESSLTPTSAPAAQEIALQQQPSGAANVQGPVADGGAASGDAAVSLASARGSAVALLPQGGLRRVSQPGLVVEREAVGPVSSRYALQAANDGVDSVMIRDSRLDEFLAAHRQGNASVLQAPVDFVRDAVMKPAP
ncbi:MAG: hypothetical protein GAK30_03087 [Paracidovorax wautersii]|uniref:Anti sigma-E protein RseA N-terminal domain-containing protein n=1 Tax=Paracidovorax wautersii TaxID=1177982 RepID=A0A7V8FLT2_9BURK|nr:MAG: hypothetical protein GAK30_03087 [Paracidovorax wautersii]